MVLFSKMNRIRKPNLFIVGEQKSGTTTLHFLLNQHPEICFSPVKEPGYFCKDLHVASDEFYDGNPWYHFRTDEEYIKLFSDCGKSRVIGDASSLYLYSKIAAKEIYDFNPQSKIIILLREPVSFLYSLHSQYLKETSEHIESFRDALDAETERKEGRKFTNNVKSPPLHYYSERVKYADNVKRYVESFGKNNVKIIIAENFRGNERSVTDDVFRFLGLSLVNNIEIKELNPSRGLRFSSVHKLLNFPWGAKMKGSIARMLPSDVTGYLIKIFHTVSRKPEDIKKLDSELERELRQRFKPEVRKLDAYLKENGYNINISVWGYTENR